MPLPPDVAVATVTFGSPASSFFGGNVSTTLTIEPTHSLIHRATKAPLLAFTEQAAADEGMPGSVTLPLTDQTGFSLASDPLTDFVGWAYKAKGRWTYKNGQSIEFEKNFQLVAGQTVVDLDEIPGGTITLPVSAPIATVTSFLGKTGQIEVEDLEDLELGGAPTSETVAPLITTAGPTKQALDTHYAPLSPVISGTVYDTNGNLLEVVENGIKTVLTYNADGSVATSKRGTDATQTFSYNADGTLAGVA